MKRFTLFFFTAIISLLIVSACTKQEKTADAEKAVKSLVEKYCTADLNGVNLSTESFLKSGISSFMVAGEWEPPGWDTVTLIKGYAITSVELNDTTATATVSYDVIGEVPGAEEVVIDRKKVNYKFRLVKKDGIWKLVTPSDLRPHVSLATTLQHIQYLYDTQKENQPKAPHVMQRLKRLMEQ